MIDIHCHLLPDLDDGAKDRQTSLQMLSLAAKDGIREIICTPHCYPGSFQVTREDVLQAFGDFYPEAEKAGVKIRRGMEVYLLPETPEQLKRGELLTLGDGGKYLLVELPSQQIPPYAASVLFQIMLQGVTPVIAHPERNQAIAKNNNLLTDFLDKGILAQLNGGSILGTFGREVRRCAETLLEYEMVQFVGSDAHSTVGRPPQLKDTFRRIEEIAGPAVREELLDNARRLLAGEAVTSHHRPVKKRLLNMFNLF